MRTAILTLMLLALPSFADVVRLDVPRSLEGEKVVTWKVPASGVVHSAVTFTKSERAQQMNAPRVISPDRFTKMIGVNGTWSDTLPECYAGTLPIQPMPDEPVLTAPATGCHSCGHIAPGSSGTTDTPRVPHPRASHRADGTR